METRNLSLKLQDKDLDKPHQTVLEAAFCTAFYARFNFNIVVRYDGGDNVFHISYIEGRKYPLEITAEELEFTKGFQAAVYACRCIDNGRRV